MAEMRLIIWTAFCMALIGLTSEHESTWIVAMVGIGSVGIVTIVYIIIGKRKRKK
jgi:L-asparagine transporter-like permease